MAVDFLSWGTTPHRTDTINTLLKRIAGADSSGGGGSGTGQAGIVGAVNPENVVSATPGTWYENETQATMWWKRSGSGATGWVQQI